MSVTPRSTLRRRLFAFLAAGIGGTVAAAVSFAMTVYEAANPESFPTLLSASRSTPGAGSVTFHEARIGTVPPTGVKPSEPKNFVMVEFDRGQPLGGGRPCLFELFTIRPAHGEPAGADLLSCTGQVDRGRHQSWMPERLIAAWEWPATLPLPGDLRLKVGSEIYKRRDNLYGASGWFDRDPVAAVESAGDGG